MDWSENLTFEHVGVTGLITQSPYVRRDYGPIDSVTTTVNHYLIHTPVCELFRSICVIAKAGCSVMLDAGDTKKSPNFVNSSKVPLKQNTVVGPYTSHHSVLGSTYQTQVSVPVEQLGLTPAARFQIGAGTEAK